MIFFLKKIYTSDQFSRVFRGSSSSRGVESRGLPCLICFQLEDIPWAMNSSLL